MDESVRRSIIETVFGATSGVHQRSRAVPSAASVALAGVFLCEARRSKRSKVSEEGIEPPILSVLSSRPNH